MLAASASAIVERRTVPGEPLDSGLRDVESIIETLELDADCRELMARDAWELSDAPAAQRLVELLPFEGRAGAPYWMESAMWEAAGVPTVVCGPAGGGLHTVVEWVELAQVRAYEEALTALIPAFGARLEAAPIVDVSGGDAPAAALLPRGGRARLGLRRRRGLLRLAAEPVRAAAAARAGARCRAVRAHEPRAGADRRRAPAGPARGARRRGGARRGGGGARRRARSSRARSRSARSRPRTTTCSARRSPSSGAGIRACGCGS